MHVNPYAAPLPGDGTSAESRGFRFPFFQWPFVVAIVIWTIVAITLAAQDRSWGALWIAICGGPAVNAGILVLAAAYGAVGKLCGREMRIAMPIAIVLATAVASTVAIFGAVMSMDLHGC